MTKFEQLVKLNNEGDLGRLLAAAFHGEIGRLNPKNDSEFLIGFDSAPDTQSIGRVVAGHYSGLGYSVNIEESRSGSPNTFGCFVHTDDGDDMSLYIVITTNYPLTPGDNHTHIRVTTTFI